MTTVTPTRLTHSRSPLPASRRPDRPSVLATSIDPLRVLRRHMLGIVAAAMLGAGIGAAAYYVLGEQYPLFSGRVMFEVQPGLQNPSDIGTIDTTNDDMVYRIAQTESYMLTSREVLGAALQNPDVQRTTWAKQFMAAGTFKMLDALDDLLEDIGTTVIRNSNLFSVNWSAHEPKDVPTVLNAIADAYLKNRKDRDRGIFDQNLALFQSQSKDTERELATVDEATRKIIISGEMTTLDDTHLSAEMFHQNELTQQITQVQASLSMNRSALKTVDEQLRGTEEPSAADIARAENDPTVMRAIADHVDLKTELDRMLKSRAPDNSLVQQMIDRVESSETVYKEKVNEIVRRNLNAKRTEIRDQISELEATMLRIDEDLESNKALLKELTARQSEYQSLQMRREHLETQRQSDIELIKEVQLMQLRADAARVRKVQNAFLPREMSFPKPEIVIPLGVLLVVGLTVGLIFLRELMDQRIRGASCLAVLPGVNVIGSIPDAEDDPTLGGKFAGAEMIVRRQPLSVLAESYRQAVTALLPQIDQAGHQTLVLVGGLPGAGTTTVATNLAAAAAAMGKTVLLVDANFRRPRVAAAMGLPADGPGLGDLLANATTIDLAIVEAGDGVSVLPAGTANSRVFDRLNNGLFDALLSELRSRYDLVIFDSPPAVVAGDAMVLANKVDASLLVVRAHQEHRGLVARMVSRLSESRSELLGVLLNRPRGIAGGYLRKNYATMAGYTSTSA